jgi:dienelactone hydrolase
LLFVCIALLIGARSSAILVALTRRQSWLKSCSSITRGGLTPGVVAFAGDLRGAGHTVHTPDLFDGRTFGSIEDVMQYAGEIGFPVSTFGSAWPHGVPAQVHGMDADPIFVGEGDIAAARDLVSQAEDAELFCYPGGRHYFAGNSLPSCHPDAGALLTCRVLDFLSTR